MMKRGNTVTFSINGETVRGVVRALHKDCMVSVEGCHGRWMGRTMRLYEGDLTVQTYPEIERAFALDRARYGNQQ